MISIIVPVFNVAEYLERCIDSILVNNCSECEIILVDDGSTDGICPAVCDRYAERFPELIRVIHQENRGQGGARNAGIEAARGKYLLFVDSDDHIAPNMLQCLKKAAVTNSDIYSFYLVHTDLEGQNKKVETSALYDGAFSLKHHPEYLLSTPSVCTHLWGRGLFLDWDIRFPSKVWYEDLRTSVKLFAAAKSIEVIPEYLYYYCFRQDSTMRNGNIRRNREIMEAVDDILLWFQEHDLYERYAEELCQLTVLHILIMSTVRVAKIDRKSELLDEYVDYVQEHFPEYRRNRYIANMKNSRKLALFLAEHRWFGLLSMIYRNRWN